MSSVAFLYDYPGTDRILVLWVCLNLPRLLDILDRILRVRLIDRCPFSIPGRSR